MVVITENGRPAERKGLPLRAGLVTERWSAKYYTYASYRLERLADEVCRVAREGGDGFETTLDGRPVVVEIRRMSDAAL